MKFKDFLQQSYQSSDSAKQVSIRATKSLLSRPATLQGSFQISNPNKITTTDDTSGKTSNPIEFYTNGTI